MQIRKTTLGAATILSLLLSITVAPTALADSEKQNFDMQDDFAGEGNGR